jgi:hypothetical protein
VPAFPLNIAPRMSVTMVGGRKVDHLQLCRYELMSPACPQMMFS